MGSVFAYILKQKDFNVDYIGKYKDKKAYSYFDSGYVGPIFIYMKVKELTQHVVVIH